MLLADGRIATDNVLLTAAVIVLNNNNLLKAVASFLTATAFLYIVIQLRREEFFC